MKIIYVGAFRLPNFDAAAPRVLNNGRAMQTQGNTVKFISWGGSYRETDLCEDGIYRIDGMEYVITGELADNGTFFHRFNTMIKRGGLSFDIIRTEIEKPDLIILYNADYGWAKKLLKYCSKTGIKLANDITEWYDNNELHFWDIIPNYLNMTRLQKSVQNKICISSFLNDYYKDSNNIILPPLCDLSEEKWNTFISDTRIAPFDGITLIYAGNPAKKDCVHTIINVVNKLLLNGKPIRFMILGTTRESYLERYASVLESKVLHENILFLGRVSQDLIPAYYKMADFMILLREPSRKNMAGFPTKFAESMSAGVPVITNATSDLSKYVHDFSTGFIVDNPDANSLENTLVNKVLPLSKDRIEKMKASVSALKSSFDYRSYTYSINQFLKELK